MKYYIKIVYMMAIIIVLYACREESVPESLATLTTASVEDITSNAAFCGGDVTSDGNSYVYEKGVCWSKTNKQPTVSDNKTFGGEGLGMFVSLLDDLSANTTYYVRAFATNSVGTSYGNVKSFKTLPAPSSGTENDKPIAKTISAKQTDAQYSAEGFTLEGSSTKYSYVYEISINLSFSNTQYASKIGFVFGDDYWYYDTFEDGNISTTMYWYSNSSSTSTIVQAYALSKDGTYVYGDKITVSLTYTQPTSNEPTVKTVSIKQTAAYYSQEGFAYDDTTRFSYTFDYEFTLSYTNTSYASNIGWLFDYDRSTGYYSDGYTFTTIKDCTETLSFTQYSNNSTENISVTAFAIGLDEETWYIGETLDLNCVYPFQSSPVAVSKRLVKTNFNSQKYTSSSTLGQPIRINNYMLWKSNSTHYAPHKSTNQRKF